MASWWGAQPQCAVTALPNLNVPTSTVAHAQTSPGHNAHSRLQENSIDLANLAT